MSIGQLYNKNNVLIGQAAGLVAPVNTPLPGDSITPFDTSVWLTQSVAVGAASAGTVNYTVGGVAGSWTYNATAGAVQTALIASLATALGLTVAQVTAANCVTVTGTGATVTPWLITFTGIANQLSATFTAVAAGLTGGTFAFVASLWRPTGATEQGWQTNYNPTTNNIGIEETPTPIGQQVSTSVLTFVANLAEATMNNLALAYSGLLTVQAPSTTLFAKTRMNLQAVLPQVAVCLETLNLQGYPRRFYIPQASVAANVGTSFRRAAGAQLIPVTFTSVCDASQIIIDDITGNHS